MQSKFFVAVLSQTTEYCRTDDSEVTGLTRIWWSYSGYPPIYGIQGLHFEVNVNFILVVERSLLASFSW